MISFGFFLKVSNAITSLFHLNLIPCLYVEKNKLKIKSDEIERRWLPRYDGHFAMWIRYVFL